MQKGHSRAMLRKPQHQRRPGFEYKMKPQPVFDNVTQKGCGKLAGKVALITGGDSGIGRAVAVLFAKEGADIAIVYLNEHRDAKDTRQYIEEYGRKCLLLPGDIKSEKFCEASVARTIKEFGRLDILINNAAEHFERDRIQDISKKQLLITFQTNLFPVFWFSQYALDHMGKGGSIINTASVTAYRGSGHLLDYSATKGAIVAFTRSLSANLVNKGIRVNAVAPGPIWTPLIASSFDPKNIAQFGSDVPMGRAGQPYEVANCYLFLASNDASYITGQVLHPNGGEIVNG